VLSREFIVCSRGPENNSCKIPRLSEDHKFGTDEKETEAEAEAEAVGDGCR